MYCWEEGAVCGNCSMVLRDNQTIIFSVSDTSILSFVSVLFSLLGCLLNIITISALLLFRRVRRHVTTLFILSVNFADLLYSLFILPMLSIRFITRRAERELWSGFCEIFPVLFYLILGASILSLMSVTVNRTCILLFQERMEKFFTTKVRITIVLVCWLIPFLLLIPPMRGTYGTINLKPYTQACTVMMDSSGNSPKSLLYNIFVFIPCSIMIICNIVIFIKVRSIRLSGIVTESTRAENIFLLMIFGVFLFFVVTLIPSWAVDKFDTCFQYPSLHAFAYILNWSGVIVNPMIFMITQGSYRDAVRALVRKLFLMMQHKDKTETTVMHMESYEIS